MDGELGEVQVGDVPAEQRTVKDVKVEAGTAVDGSRGKGPGAIPRLRHHRLQGDAAAGAAAVGVTQRRSLVVQSGSSLRGFRKRGRPRDKASRRKLGRPPPKCSERAR